MPLGVVSELLYSTDSEVSRIIPLGGVSFLVQFNSAEKRDALINRRVDVISKSLEIFRPWKKGDSAFNRLYWLLVKGVPPHVWTEDFFRVIVSCVGTMVDWSSQSSSRTRMDVAEILILTDKNAFINKVLSVKIGEANYEVALFESQFDPLDWSWPNLGQKLKSFEDNSSQDVADTSSKPDNSPVQQSSGGDPSILAACPLSEDSRNDSTSSEDPFLLRPIIERTNKESETSNMSTKLSSHGPKLHHCTLTSIPHRSDLE
ncbi:hypothetical protein Tsubulata_044224 [Turnera subulata]|uniref:DUF4283 domain-containing protein n=1 Tax=Turnera subulata TaxID=218843 RepID=A0A9Q0J1N7_9ROSI|nr:hypothetical protein Tsubulata_044224 [Turnera subulata]